jgi:DNA polymerase III subunit epsilon
LNAELGRLSIEPIAGNRIVDSLSLARRKFPGAPNSLDALCARFGIDTSRRTKHGALLDAEILAEVYAELTGGRQAVLTFGLGEAATAPDGRLVIVRPAPLPPRLSARELSSHRSFVAAMGVAPIWARYDFAGKSAASEPANES